MDNEVIAMALRMIGNNICLIADCICKEDDTAQPATEEKPKKKTRKTAKAKTEEPTETHEAEPVSEEKPTITFEQVRAALANKSRDGYTLAVKNLVESFGVEKLSEIKPEHYAEILKQAEMIGYD